MATKTSVVLIDDLDGETPADTTVSFGLDGKSYEIDLSDNNAAEFRDALSKYVSAGRTKPIAAWLTGDSMRMTMDHARGRRPEAGPPHP
jgi:hypothetical protein